VKVNDVFGFMELVLETAVKKREGKKWKQRWVVLRKDSLKSCQESYYYLFFYKDEAHSKDGKEKNTIPLADFCGVDFCRHYDKEENILILVTSSQTVYLAFDLLPTRDRWKQAFVENFGEGSTFKICIPDKQRMKAGDATIHLYPASVSIVTSNNYKCLNRWHLNDIHRYSAIDIDHFMFELVSTVKTKGGHVINLLVNDNADDVAKAFDVVTSETRNNQASTLVRHGSAMLDELGQAKRNAGDQNFFRRAILRASERMRKKKRRNTSGPTATMKSKNQCTNSMQQQENFTSLDRKKNPQISVDLDNESTRKTMHISTQDSPNQIEATSSTENNEEVLVSNCPPNDQLGVDPNKSPLLHGSVSDDAFVDAESIGANSSVPNTPDDLNFQEKTFSETDETDGRTDGREILSGINLTSVETDKSDISVRNSRRSVDSFLSYKNPAKYAIAKTKGTNPKTKNEKTPTPPPRSPVSLGLNPCVFQFPPAEEMESAIESAEPPEEAEPSPPPSTCNNNVSPQVVTNNTSDTSLSAKLSTNSPSSWTSYDSDVSLRNDAYQNLPNFKNNESFNTTNYTSNLAMRRNQKSDPLDCEMWTKATGDGKIAVPSPVDSHPNLDYVNIESDEDNSYVNVTSQYTLVPLSDSFNKKRNKPKPPRLKSPKAVAVELLKPELKNDFAKYDDDDQSIYHAVGALDEGSYENVNGVRSSNSMRSTCDYLNVNKRLSPIIDHSKLNYIELGLPPDNSNKTNCTSPITMSTSSYTSDYTRIDVDATGAINRSMVEHRQQRDNPPLRTPTRFSR